MPPRVLVLTGAGISAESGIQTFRDQNGLWENHRIEEVATPEAFEHNPQLVQQFYNLRRHALQQPTIAPNAAHLALAQLEKFLGDRFLLVTQNVDDLHQRAGNQRLLHMHGELLKARCVRCQHIQLQRAAITTVSRCENCSANSLRPHIVWFGEMPLQMDEIYQALSECEVFLSIGTSGHVYPAAGFVAEARRAGAHCLEINLESSQISRNFHEQRQGPASQQVPRWVEEFIALHL